MITHKLIRNICIIASITVTMATGAEDLSFSLERIASGNHKEYTSVYQALMDLRISRNFRGYENHEEFIDNYEKFVADIRRWKPETEDDPIAIMGIEEFSKKSFQNYDTEFMKFYYDVIKDSDLSHKSPQDILDSVLFYII